MATVTLILDTRRAKKDKTYPIKLIIRHKQKYTYIPTKYSIPEKYWDDGRIKKGCPDVNIKEVNNKLSSKLVDAENALEFLKNRNKLDRMNEKQIAEFIKNNGQQHANISFNQYLTDYLPKIPNASTREKYQCTLTAIENHQKEPVFFDEINKAWLNRFKEWRLKDKSPNTVNIDLRNIRAIFNRAIDVDEVIEQDIYPFRKFEFAKTTPRNLRLTLDELKAIRDIKLDEKHLQLARDFFMLSFYLVGMNNSDIYDITGIKDGRLEYSRNKTQKQYSIKVEPEAMNIIERWRGKDTYLHFTERFKTSHSLNHQINLHLKTIGKKDKINIPDLKMYHARHTWAGLAAKKPIGASKYKIAQALGHGKTTVTDTYFDYDTELVDDLNRKVLDLLLI